MPEPIYSRRYPKEGENGPANGEAESGFSGHEKSDYARGQLRRDQIIRKVAEVTNRLECDVDIFEGTGTMLVKIYFDSPRIISGLDDMLSMAGPIAISDAKDGDNTVLSIFYDL